MSPRIFPLRFRASSQRRSVVSFCNFYLTNVYNYKAIISCIDRGMARQHGGSC